MNISVIANPNVPPVTEPLVSMIGPAYKEEERARKVNAPHFGLGAWLAEGRAALDAAGLPAELIIVDDGSPDNTTQFALDHGANKVVTYTENGGRGKALAAGMSVAFGKYCVWSDTDNVYPWSDTLSVIEILQSGQADAVYAERGFRLKDHNGLLRLVGHFGMAAVPGLIAPVKGINGVIWDTQGGLEGWKREASQNVWPDLDAAGWEANRAAGVKANKLGHAVVGMRAHPEFVENDGSSVNLLRDAYRIVKGAVRTRRRFMIHEVQGRQLAVAQNH